MKKIMKKPLCVILFLLSGLLPFHAAPSYTMRSCAPMRSWYASPASSASATPRIGYTTAPAVSYGGRGVRTASPYSPYSVMVPSHATAPAIAHSPSYGPRKTPSESGSEYGDIVVDGDGIWYWDSEEWILAQEGSIKIEGGKTYVYIDGEWKLVPNQLDPGAPVGNTPWFWMLLLAAGYAALKMSLRVKELKS